MNKRIGIFGWGVVAPRSPNIEIFEENLKRATRWLEPFDGFGPSNFLVGRPDFEFETYKPWIEARFEPRRYSQLNGKMGNTVKYAIGAFIQALGQNPGIKRLVADETRPIEGDVAGKINMGVGGINACTICRRW